MKVFFSIYQGQQKATRASRVKEAQVSTKCSRITLRRKKLTRWIKYQGLTIQFSMMEKIMQAYKAFVNKMWIKMSK